MAAGTSGLRRQTLIQWTATHPVLTRTWIPCRGSFLTRTPHSHSLSSLGGPYNPARGSSTLPASRLPPGSFDCRRRGRVFFLFFPFFAGSGTSVQFVESVLPLFISNIYLILSPAQLGLAPTTTHLNADAQNLHRIYLVTDSSH